jgi:mRNA interferase MazF
MVIRGAVYHVDLGDAKRGHEQRGRRRGLVLSPTDMPWTVATIVPTSTNAPSAVFRPELTVQGVRTVFLVDQLRVIDTIYISGSPVAYLDRADLAEVEHAVARYLGLML